MQGGGRGKLDSSVLGFLSLFPSVPVEGEARVLSSVSWERQWRPGKYDDERKRPTHLSPHELHNVFGPIGPCQVPMEDVISLPGNEDEERLGKKRDRD